MATLHVPPAWVLVEELSEQGKQSRTAKIQHSETGQVAIFKQPRGKLDRTSHLRAQAEVNNLERVANTGANVPRIIEYRLEESPFVIMEFIDGPTLKTYVTDRVKLELDESISLFRSLLDTNSKSLALEPQVLHRDIKSGNIIVRDHRLVLVDYGLSFSDPPTDGDATQPDDNLGNFELELDEHRVPGLKRDYRSDLTSSCGVFFFMLTGKFARRLSDGKGNPPHRRPGMELPLDRPRLDIVTLFFDRAFSSSIAGRFQAVAEIESALSRFSGPANFNLKQFAEAVAGQIANSPEIKIQKRFQRSTQFIKVMRDIVPSDLPGFQLHATYSHGEPFVHAPESPIPELVCFIDIVTKDKPSVTAGILLYFTNDDASTSFRAKHIDQALFIPEQPPKEPYDFHTQELLVTWSIPDLTIEDLRPFVNQAIMTSLMRLGDRIGGRASATTPTE